MTRPLTTIASICVAALLASSAARADDCPCGSDRMPRFLRCLLVPQEFAGADFRPVCRCHDACYDTLGADKRACDQQYLDNVLNACNCSRRPVMCRIVGRMMHMSIVLGGSGAYRRAQANAEAAYYCYPE